MNETLNLGSMTLTLLGGLALFLYGLDLLVKCLVQLSGPGLKNALANLSNNRFKGAATGAATTALIQSSSATSVLVIGLISAGLLSLAQGISIIMGANVGTTMTAQLVAFKLTQYALLPLIVGFFLAFFAQRKRTQLVGHLLLGFGLLFFGMDLMSQGMAPLKDHAPFLTWMKELSYLPMAVLVGFLFTALIQSSSATIGVVIVLALEGFITLPTGIALSFGADIGTCITAVLASLGKNRDAQRAAFSHVLFNALGVVIWLPFISLLALLSIGLYSGEWLSVAALADFEQSGEAVAREIAHANTLFKLFNLLLFLPLLGLFLWAAYRLIPLDETEQTASHSQPAFLDPIQLSSASLSLQAIEKEMLRLGELTQTCFHKLNLAVINQNSKALALCAIEISRLKTLKEAILRYCAQAGAQELTPAQSQRMLALVALLNLIESLLETFKTGWLESADALIEERIKPSASTLTLLNELSIETQGALGQGLRVLEQDPAETKEQITLHKTKIDRLIREALAHQLKLINPSEKRLMTFRIEMQLIESYKRIYSLAKRMTKVLDQDPLDSARTD
jgi:phosphate:Na+ symporter